LTTIDFPNTISTLITNGFHIKSVERFSSENYIINTYKYDKLGAEIRYSILFCSDKTATSILQTLEKIAKAYNSLPLFVNEHFDTSICKSFKPSKFFDFFGGIVNTGLILIPNLPEILDELGHNKLPNGLTGEPEDLHELYTSECLQFLFESPTRRYGSDRLFEKLPDGLVLCKGRFMILFDSKAYKDGFKIKSDDINRFAYYVKDFNDRYSNYFGNIYSFIIVSGNFNDSEKSITNRSGELYKECNCKISCIKSEELGNIVKLIRGIPEFRGSINWKTVFSDTIVEVKFVQQEISRINKDKIH
jgi:hypothetical protein